ncbi:MAG: arylamine N-acetyltransferase, partial [Betaproteobacteria bacterium]|nr:arylamine N-acetyltransferase [Betaproteobacteria bacterium]
LEEDNLVDFEVGNHYMATHPSSPFVNRMMMRALTEDGRVTVMNRDVNVHRGGASEPMRLDDRGSLRRLVVDYFGFDLPEVERLRVPSIPEWG